MFYVYVYLDPYQKGPFQYGEYCFSHLPIYVGKGKNHRHKQHLTKTSNKIFENKIKNWKSNNIDPIVVFISEDITELEAWDLEQLLISRIGRYDQNKGPLLNLTDGGEGPCGRDPWNKGKDTGSFLTDDGRQRIIDANSKPKNHGEKISQALKGKPKSDEHKARLSKANKGKRLSEQTKQKQSEWQLENSPRRGKKHSKDSIEKMSKAHKGRQNTEEQKKKISESLKGRKFSDETRQKMSEARKKYWRQKKHD
jgi:hypothetical protein